MSVAIDPRRVRQFRFVDARWQDGQATLRYAVDALELTETIDFPGAPTLSHARQAAFDRALAMLHWLAGTSYYKAVAGAGPSIVFEQRSPEADEQTLVDAVYRHGLAEFAHVNGLDLDSLLHWPDVAVGVPSLVAGQGTAESKDGGQSPIESSYAAKPLGLPRRALLPLGGGKDSLVSADLLLQRNEHFALTWVGSSELIAQCAARISRPDRTGIRILCAPCAGCRHAESAADHGGLPWHLESRHSVAAVDADGPDPGLLPVQLLHGHDQQSGRDFWPASTRLRGKALREVLQRTGKMDGRTQPVESRALRAHAEAGTGQACSNARPEVRACVS